MASSLGEAGAALSTRRVGSKLSVWMDMADYRHKRARLRRPLRAHSQPATGYTARMTAVRSRIRLTTWVVLVAMLGGVLTPTSAHAVGRAAAPPASYEVCTPNGTRLKPGNSAGRDDDGRSTAKHCAECCPPSAQCTPPHGLPAAGIAMPVPDAEDPRRACGDDCAARALPARSDAQPRAPPRVN
jgi:hypothetical protein